MTTEERKLRTAKRGLQRWVVTDDLTLDADALERCNHEAIQTALADVPGVSVKSVQYNSSGEYRPPTPNIEMVGMELPSEFPLETNLPDYCDVRVAKTTPGGHTADITVWVPLRWNGRFVGTVGGGSRTKVNWQPIPDVIPIMTMPAALRNGFATAESDGGNKDVRFDGWAYDEATGEVDWELIRNWIHRSAHDMAVLGKVITAAIHGMPPEYSYLQGTSGGGQQAIVSAQLHPEDFDGIWAADPAINWTKFIPAELWPALVMKEHNNAIPPEKFEAFRSAAIAANDGPEGVADGIVGGYEPCQFDPALLVGQETDAGEITEQDAVVVRKIWDGPTDVDGTQLWFGLRPDTESWGNSQMGIGLCLTQSADDQLVPYPFVHGHSWFSDWVVREPDWDWRTLTFGEYARLFKKGVAEFAEIASDDPDLSNFRDSGGKLIISHGSADEVIFVDGTIDYYRRVAKEMGGLDATREFARLFIADGAGHANLTAAGPGISLAGGMLALMDWVENGVAPEAIVGERYAGMEADEPDMTRPICAYPSRAHYDGAGSPTDASSFTCGPVQ